jgi:hypothetical protein
VVLLIVALRKSVLVLVVVVSFAFGHPIRILLLATTTLMLIPLGLVWSSQLMVALAPVLAALALIFVSFGLRLVVINRQM